MTGSLGQAWRALRLNWARSLLTILGIVIGVTAIVLVIALGQGAQGLILQEVNNLGGNLVIIRPGRQPEGPTDVADTILSDSIKEKDLRALARTENAPGIVSIEPGVVVSGAAQYRDNVYRPFTLGWTANGMQDLFNVDVSSGTFFNDDDIKRRAKVAVLGQRVKQELFGDSDPIGQFITLKGHKLRVVGVFANLGQVAVFNVDELILIPYTTAQKTILGIDYFHEILIRTDENADVKQVAADVKATLRESHGITDPSKDDFFVLTQEDIVERISTVTNVLTIFLVAIAAISLVVGGVGIMNIMLVSVTERTHEIGLRKAVGATNQDIMRQFLLEAVILTGTGGFIGTALATSLSLLVAWVARTYYNIAWPITLPLGAIALGVGTAALIGLIFGIYPARKAANQDPISALRYE